VRLAVIPARGGSKRIPRKNIRPFAGKPMVAYAIDAARTTGLFDHVIISTDDIEIATIGRALGAEIPFMRPVELADDTTPTVPVIAHAIRSCRELGWPVRQACCIYPTAPLLDPRDIEAAFRMLDGQDQPYVFPVAEYASPVQRALRRAADGRAQPLFPEFVRTRTQDL
jgi:pseudaminic acid cytidylyltransferase